jgi:hypothetical protein
MRAHRHVRAAIATASVLAACAGAATTAWGAAPKYYFRLGGVKAGPEVSEALKSYAGETLKAELASRPEWASDIDATGTDALVAELKRRNLRGFDVSVRIESYKHEVKEPSPGARLKRLAVTVRLTVFGTTIPDGKLAFSGEGDAGLEGEVNDKRMEAEELSMAKDAVKDAVKQAVDQAVVRLAPVSEGKKHKKK